MATIAKGNTLEKYFDNGTTITITPAAGGSVRFGCSAPVGATRPADRVIYSATSIAIPGGSTVFAQAVGGDAGVLFASADQPIIYTALAASRANAPYRGPISLASGVTVTTGVVAPAVTEYRYWTGNNARYFKVFGLGASAFFEQYATTYLRAKCARTAEATYQNGVGGWAAQIRFTGQTATFSVVGSTVNYIVLVNGKPTNTAGYNQASAGRIEVNCGSSGDWEVTLVMRQDHALMGVFTDGQLHAQSPVTGARVLFIGDSFCASVTSPASTIADQGYAAQLRLQLGFDVETLVHGIGSSGYQTGNLLTNTWRTGDAAAVAPDLVVLPFGTNDVGGGATESTLKAGVVAGINAIRTACPGARILVLGPWPKNLNLSATLLSTELWISQACDSLGVPFYPINTAGANLPGGGVLDAPWVWGDGDTDTTETVAGNSKWVTGNDGTHPSPAFGSAYLAKRTVDAVVDTCKKLGW